MDVQAKVRYVNDEWRNRVDRLFISTKELRRANTSEHEVVITDARSQIEISSLDLDTSGFVLTEFPAPVVDFHNESAVRKIYETAMSPFLCKVTGAKEAFVTSHIVRTEDKSSYINAYARFVHTDYTIRDNTEFEQRVLLEQGFKSPIEQFDFAWFNVWTPIDRKVEQNALTLVDASTVDTDNCLAYFFADASTAVASVPLFDEAHRFYYFSGMEPGEALVFKQLDSREGKAKMCPHTAFYDTTVGDAVPGRRSVEFRALCLFER